MCIYCIARGVVIFCVVNMTLTCEWMNEIDMLCFEVETEETGTCTRPYWRSGISSTRERNSASFHSFRYAPLVKRWNFSHSWKKSQIFNRDSCKNLLFYTTAKKKLLWYCRHRLCRPSKFSLVSWKSTLTLRSLCFTI